MAKDYYQILGVDKNASREKIRTAYRKLAFQYHPDRNQEDPAAAEKMKEINEAYAVISDQEKRKKYDSYRESYGSFASERFRESHSEEDIFRDSDINQIFEEMSKIFGFRNFDEVFKEFYGARYHAFHFRRPGGLGRGFISFHDFSPQPHADSGSQGEFQGAGQDKGKVPFSPARPFAGMLNKYLMRKLGKTFGVTFPEKGKDLRDRLVLKPEQAQKGEKVKYPYHKWGKPQNIMVNVPPGIKDGQKIRLKGLGAEGRGGGERGDLYLEVKIQVPILQKIKSFLKGG